MKTIELKPITIQLNEYDKIELRIKAAFRQLIYEPILREFGLKLSRLENSIADLHNAILKGKINYYRGTFSGKFNASTSKELKALGAKWDRKSGTFKLTLADLPPSLRGTISASNARFEEKVTKIDEKLKKILPEEFAKQIKLSDLFDRTLWKVDKQFHESTDGIIVPAQLTKERRAKIADEWQDNMDLWIRNFTEEQIVKLRKTVQDSAFSGNRYEALADGIQKSFGVTSRKARFLARQETNLLLAKFKESRYTDSGINEYRWRCVIGSKNHPVRPSHKILNGKNFRFDDPPITTEPGQPVRRNNPGEDYNCRCSAIPIVKF